MPGFEPDDYKRIITLLCSGNDDVRRAAQRLLKLYPSDNFYRHLKSLPKQEGLDKCDLEFVSETAVFYFYNRIVEYDGTFALDKRSRDWIEGNYSDGATWVTKAITRDPSYRIFTSMLDHAYGLVLWDHSDQVEALPHFRKMIDVIRLSNRVYPSNPRHIGIALRIINEPRNMSKTAKTASPYVGERQAISTDYVLNGAMVNSSPCRRTHQKQLVR